MTDKNDDSLWSIVCMIPRGIMVFLQLMGVGVQALYCCFLGVPLHMLLERISPRYRAYLKRREQAEELAHLARRMQYLADKEESEDS